MVQHNNMEHTPEITNGVPKAYETTTAEIAGVPGIVQKMPETVTEEIDTNISKVSADIMARIKKLKTSDDNPENRDEIVALQKKLQEQQELEKTKDIVEDIKGLRESNDPEKYDKIVALQQLISPEMASKILNTWIPVLGKTRDNKVIHKMTNRGVDLGILQKEETSNIENLSPIDNLRQDVKEKTLFLIEAIKIRGLEMKMRSISTENVNKNFNVFSDIIEEAMENGWIFEEAEELRSTIAFLYTKDDRQPPGIIQNEDTETAHMFKVALKHAINNFLASIPPKKEQLIEASKKQKKYESINTRVYQKVQNLRIAAGM